MHHLAGTLAKHSGWLPLAGRTDGAPLTQVPQERDNMGPGNTYLNAPDDLLHSLEKPGIDLRW